MHEKSDNKDLALSFIKWFYEEENFSYYLDLDKGLSSLTGVTSVSYTHLGDLLHHRLHRVLVRYVAYIAVGFHARFPVCRKALVHQLLLDVIEYDLSLIHI